MENPFPRRAAANPTQYNIDAIAKLEHEALDRRSPTERVSDVIIKLVGYVGFLLAQLILISGWRLVNLHAIPGLKAFDPIPFGVLGLFSKHDLSWAGLGAREEGKNLLHAFRKLRAEQS
jgi:uncharacterized membrane protein